MIRFVSPILKILQIFFYLGFLCLWFKHNFSSLENLPLSYHLPLALFILTTAARFVQSRPTRKWRGGAKSAAIPYVLLILIGVAVLVRVPFLANHEGFLDGDDGLIILQAKHMAEGEPAAIYNYGVVQESSTLMHVYALIFILFGYSTLLPRVAALCIYLGFVVVQYLFLHRMFSSRFAALVCLFYCLPVGHTLITSLNLSGDFPSILFLGSLVLYLTYLIYSRDKENLLPVLGFLMGLSFWVHQMTITCILTSLFVLVLKYKLRIKKYVTLGLYVFIGVFPVVLSEVMTGFGLLGHLLSGSGARLPFFALIRRSYGILGNLLTRQDNILSHFFVFLVFVGFFVFLFLWHKHKSFLPHGIFVVFFVFFFTIYLLSKFSSRIILSVRYLYPLYFVLPVFLFALIFLIAPKIRYIFGIALLTMLFVSANLTGFYLDYVSVRTAQTNVRETVEAMVATGEKYWAGGFWDAFQVTTISGESVVACEYPDLGHYPAYRLSYHNLSKNNNFLFLQEIGIYRLAYREMLDRISSNLDRKMSQAESLLRAMESFEIAHNKKNIGNNLLIYGVDQAVSLEALQFEMPEFYPRLILQKVESSRGQLRLIFQNVRPSQIRSFRLHVEIPGYASEIIPIPTARNDFEARIPYPDNQPVDIRYYIDYLGMNIPTSVGVYKYSPDLAKPEKVRKRIMILQGRGANVKISGIEYRILEQEVSLEFNQPTKRRLQVRLHIHSPLDFSNPGWHGDFYQDVSIDVNDHHFATIRLRDRDNVIEIVQEGEDLKNRNTVVLRFKYHWAFKFMPWWMTSALLEKIELF